MIKTLNDLGFESEISDYIARSESAINELFSKSRPQNGPPQFGGGISYRISNDPGIESAIPDFIIRTESAKNDLFSKFRLHSLYVNYHLLMPELLVARG